VGAGSPSLRPANQLERAAGRHRPGLPPMWSRSSRGSSVKKPGSSPVSWLRARRRSRNCLSWASSGGMGPLRRLSDRYRFSRLRSCPSWGGMGPESWLRSKNSPLRELSWPSWLGMLPLSWLSCKQRFSRRLSRPSSGGMIQRAGCDPKTVPAACPVVLAPAERGRRTGCSREKAVPTPSTAPARRGWGQKAGCN
jgi:hypothetical protein